MDISNAVKGETVYGKPPAIAAPRHVAFGLSGNYVRPWGIAMTSVVAHTPGAVVHAFVDREPTADDSRRITATVAKYEAQVVWHTINAAAFARMPRPAGVSVATYYRFLAADHLYGMARRLLYLDADTLCLRNLAKLWDAPLDDIHTIAAVRDEKRLGDCGRNYFNAGVLFIDVDAWHVLEVSDKAVDLLNSGHRYRYLDQDVLNIIYNGQVVWLPNVCNQLPEAASQHTAIVHYTGGSKPWTAWFLPMSDGGRYEQWRLASAWADVPLDSEPRNNTERRLMSRVSFQRGHYAAGCWWQLRYLGGKIAGQP